jgi:hypothetical protein
MATKKQAKPVVAKVGNYAAKVDTAGMDPAMKRTMGIGAKKVSLRALLKGRKGG